MSYQELSSHRLILLKPSDNYVNDLYYLRTHPSVNKYIQRIPSKSIDEVTAFIEKTRTNIHNNQSYYWFIVEKNNAKFTGTICLWNFSKDQKTAEIGYELLPEHQGKGFMNEALGLVLKFGLEILKLQVIEAYTHKDNHNSIKLLKKNGFQKSVNNPTNNDINNNVFELKK